MKSVTFDLMEICRTSPDDGYITLLQCGHGFGFKWLRTYWDGKEVRYCPKCQCIDTEPLYDM